MKPLARILPGAVVAIGILMVATSAFQLDKVLFGLRIGQYFPLAGAVTGGLLTIGAAGLPRAVNEAREGWLRFERLSWLLIGGGIVLWGIGEGLWRYDVATARTAFPSLADIGYGGFPLLVFGGLLLQPPASEGRGRLFMFLDSLISAGAIAGIAWSIFLEAGLRMSLSANPATWLAFYYPVSDLVLLSSAALLLLRSQGEYYQASARRGSLFIVVLGLCLFVASDLIFRTGQLRTGGTYGEGTWLALGWPLGMLALGLAAYVRRSLPATSRDQIEQRMRIQREYSSISLAQLLPHILLTALFVILVLNAFLQGDAQLAIRSSLLFATLALVVARQFLTLRDNEHSKRGLVNTREHYEQEIRQLEGQARSTSQRNTALELGIAHLKEVQARLVNGDLRTRARLIDGELLPLAGTLNLLADRLMRLEQWNVQAQRMRIALEELGEALERLRGGGSFVVPASCKEFPEVNRLLLSLGLAQHPGAPRLSTPPDMSWLASQGRAAHHEERGSDQVPSLETPPADAYAQNLRNALNDLSLAIERYRNGETFVLPPSCGDFPEINRLLIVIGLRQYAEMPRTGLLPEQPEGITQINTRPEQAVNLSRVSAPPVQPGSVPAPPSKASRTIEPPAQAAGRPRVNAPQAQRQIDSPRSRMTSPPAVPAEESPTGTEQLKPWSSLRTNTRSRPRTQPTTEKYEPPTGR